MKTLVCTTAFGSSINFTMVQAMVVSLRATGYDRDVIVLTDKAYDFPVDLRARVIVIDSPESKPLYKASLPDDIAKLYDAIAIVDSDTVWLKSPDSVFPLVTDRMLISRIRCRLTNDSYNRRELTDAEDKLKAQGGIIDPVSRSVNTGTIFFPGAQYTAYATAWKTAWAASKKPPVSIGDQPVMQAMMLRGQIKYDYLPDGIVVFPFAERFTLPTDGTVIAHFAGYPSGEVGSQKCIEDMAAYPANLAKISAAKAAAGV